MNQGDSAAGELDVVKLISAVRGSQAACVLFEYRCHLGAGKVASTKPPTRHEDVYGDGIRGDQQIAAPSMSIAFEGDHVDGAPVGAERKR